MCEVVGKAFPDEMVFLQGAKGMLENGFVGYVPQRGQQFAKCRCLFPLDTQQMRRGVEIKRVSRAPNCGRGHECGCHLKELSSCTVLKPIVLGTVSLMVVPRSE